MSKEPLEWQPIKGCSPASIGCANCRNMSLAQFGGLTVLSRAGPVWSGKVRFDEQALAEPLKAAGPCRYHVCSHGDLFHPSVEDDWIDDVFAVMATTPHHQFQVLTKRSNRMRDYLVARPSAVLPNVSVGVSAERQREADMRIPELGATPAHVRFITLYPLLGGIDLEPFIGQPGHGFAAVFAGEEPERPADPEWFNKVERQCLEFGVPYGRAGLVGEA